MRTQLLPEPQRSDSARLLREYTDVRARISDPRQLKELLPQSEKLHADLWKAAIAAAENHAESITIGLYLQSLNETIDLHSRRVFVGLRSRIPMTIWITLFGLTILGLASVGYQAGLAGTRRSPEMPILTLAFAGVLFLTVDAGFKLLATAAAAEASADLGWTGDSIHTLGIIQVVCLVAYLVPRTQVLGALLWTGYLGGAIATHLRVDNPLFGRGLKFGQRICYANGMLHFFYGIPRIIFLLAPICYLFFGLHIVQAAALSICAYVLPHIAHANIANSRIQGKYRHSFWSDVYEAVLAWYVALPTAMVSAILCGVRPCVSCATIGSTKRRCQTLRAGGAAAAEGVSGTGEDR